MPTGAALRDLRRGAGLTQAQLALRTRTSQATISAYERDRKQPSLTTLGRLATACGGRLRIDASTPVRRPSAAELDRAGRTLEEVIAFAELLPTRHDPELRYPRLPPGPASA